MKTLSIANDQDEDIYPKVLVVGMSRTGTSSIKNALETLYDKPVYHGSVILRRPTHLKFWLNLSSASISLDDVNWNHLLKGYVAVTDLPSAYYFESLIKAFPDAKIILSIRDEQIWTDSYCRLIQAGQRFRLLRFLPPISLVWPITEQMHKLVFGKKVVGKNGVDRAAVLEGYRRHNERVKSKVPAECLLVFDVNQGWTPLCKFLKREIPDEPFPFLNSGAEGPIKMLATAVSRVVWIPMFVLLLAVLLVVVTR